MGLGGLTGTIRDQSKHQIPPETEVLAQTALEVKNHLLASLC